MIFRLRWKQLGGHFHCRLFQAPSRQLMQPLIVEASWSKNGDLVFDEAGWLKFRLLMEEVDVEVLEEVLEDL